VIGGWVLPIFPQGRVARQKEREGGRKEEKRPKHTLGNVPTLMDIIVHKDVEHCDERECRDFMQG
jgi:hypothetical protein